MCFVSLHSENYVMGFTSFSKFFSLNKIISQGSFFGFLLSFFSTQAQYLEVNDSYTAQQLVKDVFIGTGNLSCIEVSNITFSNYYNFGGSQMSYGYFSKAASDFNLDEGVLLTTGKATSAIGPNGSLLSEGPPGNAWPGDQDLEQAVGMTNTVNATVLEFDFISYTNHISFDYIFASEQYLTSGSSNQCNYTDAFAFLIKRANVNESYTNLAVVPGTSTPVAVNTVRGPGGLCPPVNAQYFEGFNPEEHPINYNGQTVVLTAQTDIIAGELYHIKLVIADQGNNLYDSAVFLKGGSFSSGKIDLGPDRLVSTGNPICEGGSFDINATTPNADTYQWYKDGLLIPGATSAIYQATETGDYEVNVGFTDATCYLIGEIRVEFTQNLVLSNTSLIQCEGSDGSTVFNLALAESSIIQYPEDFEFGYFENITDAHNNSQNSIQNPNHYIINQPNKIVYVRVENQFGCYSIAEIALFSTNNTLQNPPDLEACDDNADGIAVFTDLSQHLGFIDNQVPINPSYTFHQTYEDAILLANPLSISNYQGYNNQTIYIRISEDNERKNCYGITWFNLVVRSLDADLDAEAVFLCEGQPSIISAPAGFSDYLWSNGETSQSIEISQSGTYTVTITNEFGCNASKTFVINSSTAPEIVSITIQDMNQGENSVYVEASGNGIYEFSLNGIDYQQSNLFTNVPSGQYLVFVRGVCGQAVQPIFVLQYPKFFTPNGDGLNDYWNIPMLSAQYPTAQIEIYDRYGKLLSVFSAQNQGWDGSFNSERLPATDYWFVVRLPERTVRGHFSLLR